MADSFKIKYVEKMKANCLSNDKDKNLKKEEKIKIPK
jgi:hypothetical protein